jgi:hypothetical protein
LGDYLSSLRGTTLVLGSVTDVSIGAASITISRCPSLSGSRELLFRACVLLVEVVDVGVAVIGMCDRMSSRGVPRKVYAR